MIESNLLQCRSRVFVGCAAVCFVIAAGLVYVSHALPGAESYDEELMYFPSGKFLKEASLGHEMIVADMAWVRAIQYYGRHRQTDQDYGMSDFLNRIDTIFFGRKSYELMLKMSKNPFPDKIKYVFSKTKKLSGYKTQSIPYCLDRANPCSKILKEEWNWH